MLTDIKSFNIVFKNAFLIEKRFVFHDFGPEVSLALETGDSSDFSPDLFKRYLETYLETAPEAIAKFIKTADEQGNQPLVDIVLKRFKEKWGEYLEGVKISREKISKLNIENPPEELAHVASYIRRQIENTCMSLRDEYIKNELRESSFKDELTDLLNRRGYEERIKSRIARSEREKIPLSLLVTDVDHFKVFNDTHGHHAGDQVLVELSKRFVQATRDTDIVCRWGGEEFAIILDGADEPKGIAAAGRIMETVTREPFEITDQSGVSHSVKVTVSIGGRNYQGDRKEMETGADNDLYVSKGGGKKGEIVDQNGAVGDRNALTFNNRLYTSEEIEAIRRRFSTAPPKPPIEES